MAEMLGASIFEILEHSPSCPGFGLDCPGDSDMWKDKSLTWMITSESFFLSFLLQCLACFFCRCYFLHTSIDSVSPVFGIFIMSVMAQGWIKMIKKVDMSVIDREYNYQTQNLRKINEVIFLEYFECTKCLMVNHRSFLKVING